MSQREQIEYEKKMKLKKVEYRLYTGEDTINDVGEWIYDYFNNKTKAKAKPMITVNNYNTEKSKINWNELPSNIRELRTDVEGIMEFYNDDKSIKETVDIFIKKLNAANKPKSKPPAPKKKEPRPKKPTPKKKRSKTKTWPSPRKTRMCTLSKIIPLTTKPVCGCVPHGHAWHVAFTHA